MKNSILVVALLMAAVVGQAQELKNYELLATSAAGAGKIKSFQCSPYLVLLRPQNEVPRFYFLYNTDPSALHTLAVNAAVVEAHDLTIHGVNGGVPSAQYTGLGRWILSVSPRDASAMNACIVAIQVITVSKK